MVAGMENPRPACAVVVAGIEKVRPLCVVVAAGIENVRPPCVLVVAGIENVKPPWVVGRTAGALVVVGVTVAVKLDTPNGDLLSTTVLNGEDGMAAFRPKERPDCETVTLGDVPPNKEVLPVPKV